MLKHSISGEQLWLMSEKVIFWPKRKSLFISDVHLGKVNHFRKNGFPIPQAAGIDNYNRLKAVIHHTQPHSIIFLGDLFHSHINQDWLLFESFAKEFPGIKLELVVGNHDIINRDILLNVVDDIHEEEYILSPFILTHHPRSDNEYYNLCGHIHPSVRIKGRGHQSIKLPCFYFTPTSGILPAFGSFTGTHTIVPENHDDVFLIVKGEVVRF